MAVEGMLAEQLAMLRASATRYDAGDEWEAVRLATTLRVLLHDGRHAQSLLGQLGLLDSLQWLDTAIRPTDDPMVVPRTTGLTIMEVSPGALHHKPRLGAPTPLSPPFMNEFSSWWDDVVLEDSLGNEFSRSALVRTAADKEGGAHVDPDTDAAYDDLARRNSIGWVTNGGDPASNDAARASIRQIAHEVLETLKRRPVGRNDPCPCGSGKKSKHCHGR
jgi:hypothetical protein